MGLRVGLLTLSRDPGVNVGAQWGPQSLAISYRTSIVAFKPTIK
jgi:hypothetical protein